MLQLRENSGFTLIETMAAALILGISITGVMTLLGVGVAVETDGGFRRQARMIAASTLEQPAYHFSNYNGLTPGAGPWPASPDTSLKASREGAPPLPATLAVTVSPATTWALADAEGSSVPVSVAYKTITAQVSWTLDGHSETVTLVKTITEIP